MIYLKKFETTAQYNAAQSSLILPNVSLVTENNKVEYNPLSPTPSLSVVAVYDYETEVELPYCGFEPILKLNRPISYDELLNLKIVASNEEDCETTEEYTYSAVADGAHGQISWRSNSSSFYFTVYKFEGTSDTIEIQHDDFMVKWFNFYFE